MSLPDQTHTAARAVSEEDVVQAALVRGLVTPQEVEHARAARARHARYDRYVELLDLLVEQQMLTRNQIHRLKEELKASATASEIPGYQMLALLGRGAMGHVYKARQRNLDRIVAVKILLRHHARNKDLILRLEREATLMARLSSEHIVAVYDRGEVHGQHFVVMEFVDGVSAMHRIEGAQLFKQDEVIALARQLLPAMHHMHRRGVVHRDIKPGNLVATPEGTWKLMDFGLARDLRDRQRIDLEEGTAIGTPYYISPEQIRGVRGVDRRSDLYSFGASLYHMMVGQPPFTALRPVDILSMHLKERPVPPHKQRAGISVGMSKIIHKLLAKNPAERYPDALALLADIEALT